MEERLKQKLKTAIRELLYNEALDLMSRLNDENADDMIQQFKEFNAFKAKYERDLMSILE